MPCPRPILGASFSALLALIVASARAEEAPALGLAAPEPGSDRGDDPALGPENDDEALPRALTWSQEALEGIASDPESPELRMLRLAEEELFSRGEALKACDATCERARAASAEAPPASYERDGKQIDVSFLKTLKLPELPVRWDARVIEYLLFFKDDPRGRELASGWVKRKERYGAMIRRVLGEHALPSDLQYVAMIESGYDPRARSAVDAYGMWQFVQAPAEHYGLRVDHWVDERLDPERSTRSAARFLRDLHERFGTWELSFAAYNMGYGGLLRAIRKYNTNDYWLLSHLEAAVPFETALYVAKITAMAIVAHNPAAFGFDKLPSEPASKLVKVDVAGGSALADVASAAGIELEQLVAANPHLKRSRVPPGEPSAQLYLPREAQVRFAQRWSTREQSAPLAHVLRFGETMEDVAKRAGITTLKLRELNELASDARVAPGFALIVPAGSKPTSDLVEPLVASVPERAFHYEGRKRMFYRVGVNETPADVARLFDVTLDELDAWNNLEPSAALQHGMLLQVFVVPEVDLSRAVVYDEAEVRVLTMGSNEFFDYHEAQRGRVRVRYRVQRNDSMTKLAERFDLSVGSIGRINQFASQRELEAGEWITMYVAEAEAPKLAAAGLIERIGEGARADAERAPAELESAQGAASRKATVPVQKAHAAQSNETASAQPRDVRSERVKGEPEKQSARANAEPQKPSTSAKAEPQKPGTRANAESQQASVRAKPEIGKPSERAKAGSERRP